jgi:hypothetical protein
MTFRISWKKVFISLAVDDTIVICNVTFETDVIDIPVVILIVAISDSVIVVVLNKVGSTGCVQL